jgi:hypothetical protein
MNRYIYTKSWNYQWSTSRNWSTIFWERSSKLIFQNSAKHTKHESYSRLHIRLHKYHLLVCNPMLKGFMRGKMLHTTLLFHFHLLQSRTDGPQNQSHFLSDRELPLDRTTLKLSWLHLSIGILATWIGKIHDLISYIQTCMIPHLFKALFFGFVVPCQLRYKL